MSLVILIGMTYRNWKQFLAIALDVHVKHGAKRIRTADPLNAIEVLYQLSYNPVQRFPLWLDNYASSSSRAVTPVTQ